MKHCTVKPRSNAWHMVNTQYTLKRMDDVCMHVLYCGCVLSSLWLFATLWTVTRQAPLSMGFFRQENWSELPFPSPGELPNPGIDLAPLVSLHCRQILYPLSYQGSPMCVLKWSEVAQLCLTLCNPLGLLCDSSWNSPGQNAGVGSRTLLQGIFPS